MLNRAALMAQLIDVSDALFADFSGEYNRAHFVWQQMVADPTFIHKVQQAHDTMPWQMPLWTGRLDTVIDVHQKPDSYIGLSVDGSQIYPDRHQGTSCFLINIGSVALGYGISGISPFFESVPHVFTGDRVEKDVASAKEGFVKEDYINCIRQEFELHAGLELIKRFSTEDATFNQPVSVLLVDGSLIFWHLASKQHDLRQSFLRKYVVVLEQWHQARALHAGYISAPKSKELVSLIRSALCNFDPRIAANEVDEIEHVVDATIARFFLQPGTRTTIFKSMSSICQEYPHHLHPHFFYLHVGTEIARVEIPFWIANSDKMVNQLCRIIIDQCQKGFGYPVLIAEAHEQAVVKGPDRDFFYHLVAKMGVERKRHVQMSAKNIRKRGIGI